MILGTVLVVGFTTINYNRYVQSNNEAILRVITAFMESDTLSKAEIVEALENKDLSIDETILTTFGYNLDTKYFLNVNEDNLNRNLLLNIIAINISILIFTAILLWLEYARAKKINHFIGYLQELCNKNYTLDIADDKDDELSKLKKELYHIAVLLKEQAEHSTKDKLAVKNNIVDISHQLKTPLTSITLMLDNIIDFPQMDEETKNKFLLSIRENVLHMEFLLKNLLKLSKFDANVITFKKDIILVKDLVNHSIKNLERLILEKEINLLIKGDDYAHFIGDFKWQLEAISNIIKNAIEHSHRNGQIEISYSMNNFYNKIIIKDYGTGISNDNIRKIFTRYYKDENSTEESVGIGLNLAKMIIEKDSGTINVHSKTQEYTCFEICYYNND